MFSGHENVTVEELRKQIGAWPSTALGLVPAISGLIGAIMILCNRIEGLEHRLLDRHYDDGEKLVAALPDLAVGTRLVYHGVLHEVIDAGLYQGHRVKAVEVPGLYQEMDDSRLV